MKRELFYDRIMVIEPHPDDMILMCGGFVARAIKEGKRVFVLTITGGGGAASSVRKAKAMVGARASETELADKVLGVANRGKDIHRKFLHFSTDKFLRNIPDGYKAILKEIRGFGPDLVITTHKDNRHPLHSAVAEMIEEMLFQAGENIRQEELGEPVKADLWLGENPRDQMAEKDLVYVDVTDSFAQKAGAVRTQISQVPVLGHDILEKVEILAKFRGMRSGVKYAEAFRKVNIYERAI